MKRNAVSSRPQWLAHAWDHISIYLPILSMGLLALGSYWVLRNAPPPPAPVAERPVRHEPDYFMRGFSVRDFDAQGQLTSEVTGREMRHYPDDGSMEVDVARLRSLNPNGAVTHAQADRLSANAAQTVYVLEKQVRVSRDGPAQNGKISPRVEFEGEQLRILVEADRIESDLPVWMTRGGDRITADSLRYDDNQRVADLQGNVRATLAPRP